MIAALVVGDAAIQTADNSVGISHRNIVSATRLDAAASGMQVAARDIRLARSADDLKKSEAAFADRLKITVGFADELLRSLRSQDNRDRATTIRGLIDQYDAGMKEIAAVKGQIIALVAKANGATATPEVTAQIQTLNQDADRLARERTCRSQTRSTILSGAVADSAQKVTMQRPLPRWRNYRASSVPMWASVSPSLWF